MQNIIKVLVEYKNPKSQNTSNQVSKEFTRSLNKALKFQDSQFKKAIKQNNNFKQSASNKQLSSQTSPLKKELSGLQADFKNIRVNLNKYNKELAQSLKTISKNNNSDNNAEGAPKGKNKSGRAGKFYSSLIPMGYYSGQAVSSFNSLRMLEAGHGLTDSPLGFAQKKEQATFDLKKSIGGMIGSIIGSGLGALTGSPYGVMAGGLGGGRAGELLVETFGGTTSQARQRYLAANQSYVEKMRGNATDQTVGGMLRETQRTKGHPNQLYANQIADISTSNQYGKLSPHEISGIAKLSYDTKSDPKKLSNTLTQFKSAVGDLSSVIKQIDKSWTASGGDLNAQTATALQLVQLGGLSPSEAVQQAFNQKLGGDVFASAQNAYTQASIPEILKLRAMGQALGINSDSLMAGDSGAISKFNQLQATRKSNLANKSPTGSDALLDVFADTLGFQRGKINFNPSSDVDTRQSSDTMRSEAEREHLEAFNNNLFDASNAIKENTSMLKKIDDSIGKYMALKKNLMLFGIKGM